MDLLQQSCNPSQSPIYLLINSSTTQNNNKTYIDNIEQKAPFQKKSIEQGNKAQEKECRICLEGQNKGSLGKYCSCIGTAEFAHQDCISEWILRKENEKKRCIKCQVCHQPYNYVISNQSQLACEDFQSHWNSKRTQIVIFCIAILICICGLAFFISSIFKKDLYQSVVSQRMSNSKIFFMCIIITIIIWSLVILALLYIFISKFLMRKIKIVRLDISRSIKLLKLAQSIKQCLSNKTASSW